MNTFGSKDILAPTLSLFTSAGTLICCALPALFISLGMGATLAGLISDMPQLVWLSEHKMLVFGFAAIMLTVAGIMQYRGRNAPCPINPKQAAACKRLRKISIFIYGFSLLIFLIGVFFAFVAPYILI